MTRGSNPGLRVGDILLNTITRRSLRVLRLIGNSRVEVVDLEEGSTSQLIDSAQLVRGITSGSVRRVFSTSSS